MPPLIYRTSQARAVIAVCRVGKRTVLSSMWTNCGRCCGSGWGVWWCQDTFKATKTLNTHMGPCNNLKTHLGVHPPSTICSWNRLQHPPDDPKMELGECCAMTKSNLFTCQVSIYKIVYAHTTFYLCEDFHRNPMKVLTKTNVVTNPVILTSAFQPSLHPQSVL